MLITVDKGDAQRGAPLQPQEPPLPPAPPAAAVQTPSPAGARQTPGNTSGSRTRIELWAIAVVVALVATHAALSGGMPFSLSNGHREQVIAPLPHQLPYGKGMWMWQPEKSDGGDAGAIVARAKAVGLTHIYVRTGSSWDGFYAGPFLDHLLPVAHKAGIRVYGWDFPRLIDPADDVARALAAISYVTPTQQRIDGFAADIETRSEGTHISAEAATAYGDALRAGVGAGFPLIACVPRPSMWTKSFYPYAEVVAQFDAVAPMVYWLNRQPDSDAAGALKDLLPLGKPVFPVGQAFDGGPDGGRPGMPTPFELQQFMWASQFFGGEGVSFWSWQAADQEVWNTIRDAPQFAKAPVRKLPLQPLRLEAG